MSEQPPLDHSACLVVFCKRPGLLVGKQRLAKTIGAEQALAFARSFLDCALEDAAAWPGPVVLSPASPDDAAWAGGLLARDCTVLSQPPGGLGERLQTVDHKLRQEGQHRIIFIGSDAPALKAQHYNAARGALDHADVVLCPADDGGVTIMGARCRWPELGPLPWGTGGLGAALEEICRQQGLATRILSSSYDIDVEADLCRLRDDLANDRRPARRHLYQQISLFLKEEAVRYA